MFFFPKCLVSANELFFEHVNSLFRVSYSTSNLLNFATMLLEDRHGEVCIGRINHITKSYTHIEHLEHFAVWYVSISLYQREDWMGLNKLIYDKTDFGIYPC